MASSCSNFRKSKTKLIRHNSDASLLFMIANPSVPVISDSIGRMAISASDMIFRALTAIVTRCGEFPPSSPRQGVVFPASHCHGGRRAAGSPWHHVIRLNLNTHLIVGDQLWESFQSPRKRLLSWGILALSLCRRDRASSSIWNVWQISEHHRPYTPPHPTEFIKLGDKI